MTAVSILAVKKPKSRYAMLFVARDILAKWEGACPSSEQAWSESRLIWFVPTWAFGKRGHSLLSGIGQTLTRLLCHHTNVRDPDWYLDPRARLSHYDAIATRRVNWSLVVQPPFWWIGIGSFRNGHQCIKTEDTTWLVSIAVYSLFRPTTVQGVLMAISSISYQKGPKYRIHPSCLPNQNCLVWNSDIETI